jgi:hypothetical protein
MEYRYGRIFKKPKTSQAQIFSISYTGAFVPAKKMLPYTRFLYRRGKKGGGPVEQPGPVPLP